MDKLDLHRLHNPGPPRRGEGRTTRLVAEIIGNVEMAPPRTLFVVWIPEGRWPNYLIHIIADVAHAMGIAFTGGHRRGSAIFKDTVEVRVMQNTHDNRRSLDGYRYAEFYDF